VVIGPALHAHRPEKCRHLAPAPSRGLLAVAREVAGHGRAAGVEQLPHHFAAKLRSPGVQRVLKVQRDREAVAPQ